jgi:hypothetical protein
MSRRSLWLAVAVFLALYGLRAWAQGGGAMSSERPALSVRKEANFLRIGNQPTVLTWARGLTRPADLPAYAGAGFNTLYVLVTSDAEEELGSAAQLLSEAEAHELYAIVAMAPSAVHDDQGQPLAADPTSAGYVEAVEAVVAKVVGALKGSANLIAWSVEAVPPEAFSWNDAAFRVYLRDWYQGSLSRLNESWGASVANWDDITLSGARSVDSALPAGLGRASVDYAMYRHASYADALSLWATALRKADPDHLVFASALPDYRSIISVPNDFQGVILNTYPTVAEADFDTHNVHAIDIGRRANQFAAIPTLWVDRDPEPNRTANWAYMALLHGAAGVAFSSWEPIRDSEPMQAVVKQLCDDLRATPEFPARPLASAAILYQPIAGGASRNGKALYGYLDGLTPNEPSTLFAVARRGSRYGQLDVLAVSSLREVDLSRYGAIFAPMVLSLPEPEQLVLNNFVLQGGALVTDAGIGMYQADGTVNGMPPVVAEMLGMRYTEIAESNQPSEYGSPGQPGEAGQPGIAVPVGPGEAGLTIDPDIARFADILQQFLSRPDVRKYLGEEFIGDQGPGFRVRGLGRGFAVYAPTFLYQAWNGSDPFFNEFHDRILSWRRELELIQPEGLWPAVDAALYADWSVALSSPAGQAATLDLYGRRNQMYLVPRGAMRVGNPEEEQRIELLFPGQRLAIARPVPIYLRTFDEGAIVTASLIRYDAGGIELLVCGVGAEANATRDGIRISGGGLTNVEIEIHNGTYRLPPSSMHRVVVEEGLRPRPQQEEMMPNPQTGLLVIQLPLRAARITITPAE